MRLPKIDFTGKKVGRLTVIKEIPKEIGVPLKWECLCDCGNKINVRACHLSGGHTQSCGCLHKDWLKSDTRKKPETTKAWRGYEEISLTYFRAIQNGAKIRNIEFNVTIEYLWSIYIKQDKKCALTGIPIIFTRKLKEAKATASLDRKDSTKGYIEGNIQWLHKDINKIKWDLPESKFIQYCNQVSFNSLSKMGNLYNTRCYLAGNLENSKDPFTWRDEITKFFEKIGVITLDPTKDVFLSKFKEDKEFKANLEKLRSEEKYDEVQVIMKEVVRKDLRMIDICDFAIFCLEPDKPTYGTIHELINCAYDRKPILVLIPSKKKMPFWLLRYTTIKNIFETTQDLKNYLTDISDGKVELDDKYWKILKPEYRFSFMGRKNNEE